MALIRCLFIRNMFTARQRSCGKVMFSVVCVCSRGPCIAPRSPAQGPLGHVQTCSIWTPPSPNMFKIVRRGSVNCRQAGSWNSTEISSYYLPPANKVGGKVMFSIVSPSVILSTRDPSPPKKTWTSLHSDPPGPGPLLVTSGGHDWRPAQTC